MRHLLAQRGIACLTPSGDLALAEEVKRKLAYVARDYEQEMRLTPAAQECTFELPDSSVITVGTERFRCGEALFQPSVMSMECAGVHETLHSSIVKCDADLHKDLYNNILLSGGNTLFLGVADRLQSEFTRLAPETMAVRVIAPPERKYSVWLGGSILTSLSTFAQMQITKADYNESGPSIIHRKCF